MEPINSTNIHDLSSKILLDIQPYLTKSELDKLPMPDEGNSRSSMRILESKGVLIRIAENEQEKKHLTFRINRMMVGRKIIAQNNLKQIKIPKANLTENYLIENLLPRIPGGLFSSIAFYMQNYRFFDSAVSEFTEFLLKISLDDIVGNNGWMTRNWPCGVPRYDNVLIYKKTKHEKTTYKIGLIDLEHLYYNESDTKNHLLTAKNIIVLFPYQYNVIMATFQKVINFSEKEKIHLNSCKRSAKASIKKVYEKHCDFLIENSKLEVNPFIHFVNSKQAQAQLISEMLKEISDWNKSVAKTYKVVSGFVNLLENKPREFEKLDQAIVYLKLLGENPEEMIEYCEKNLLYPFLNDVCKIMKESIVETENQTPFTNFKMLSDRTLVTSFVPSHEEFTCNSDGNPYYFTAKELLTKFDKTLVRVISPQICDSIVKSQLQTGITALEIKRLMFDLFKKKGFIAEVFNDEKFITIVF